MTCTVKPSEVYYKWTKDQMKAAIDNSGLKVVGFRIAKAGEQYLSTYDLRTYTQNTVEGGVDVRFIVVKRDTLPCWWE